VETRAAGDSQADDVAGDAGGDDGSAGSDFCGRRTVPAGGWSFLVVASAGIRRLAATAVWDRGAVFCGGFDAVPSGRSEVLTVTRKSGHLQAR
jgi:hypothetical protein